MKKRVMFDESVPALAIESFRNRGYDVVMYGGDTIDKPCKPIYNLAKTSNTSFDSIYWGNLSTIVKRRQVDLFITTKDGIEGSTKLTYDESINLADAPKTVVQERWVTHSIDSKSGESCPICTTLEDMGWVEQGVNLNYTWPGGSKIIDGLPLFRTAHSSIGDGSWAVGDDKCNCTVDFRMSTKASVQLSEIHFHICDSNCKH